MHTKTIENPLSLQRFFTEESPYRGIYDQIIIEKL